MHIIVCSREMIEQGLPVKAGAYAVISVRDPNSRRVKVRRASALQAVLELAFHDAEPVGSMPLPANIKRMTEDDATRIARFVLRYRDHINALIVHCEQGMSRSPGIAAGVAEALGLDVSRYDRDYQPNPFVREMVIEAFAREIAQQSHSAERTRPV